MKLNKYQRIQFVKDFDLNTENNILINPEDSYNQYVNFLSKLKKCSIRTFRGSEVVTPHYPIIRTRHAKDIISQLQKQKYHVILATPIDPEDCELAGAAWQKSTQLFIEIAYGPGTVRRVTHNNIIDERFILNNNEYTTDERVNKCIKEFRKTGLENVIFEFSWYNKKIGHKKENFICWEITDDGTKRSNIF